MYNITTAVVPSHVFLFYYIIQFFRNNATDFPIDEEFEGTALYHDKTRDHDNDSDHVMHIRFEPSHNDDNYISFNIGEIPLPVTNHDNT